MLGFTLNPQKRFAELGEREILALAITLEEEDGRIYRDFAEGLREGYPATAKVFDDMAEEESGHRRMLIDLYRERFGEHIPLVRREDVRGFVRRKPIWLTRPLGVEAVRRRAEELEQETANFYREAAKQVTDASIRKLLVDLAEIEVDHAHTAHQLEEHYLTEIGARERGQDRASRLRAAVCPAGARRAHGRLGLDPGAAVRRGVRDRAELGRVPGGCCGLDRCRDLDGLRRGTFGRRQHHRPRPSLAARLRLRPDDHAGRASATPCRS